MRCGNTKRGARIGEREAVDLLPVPPLTGLVWFVDCDAFWTLTGVLPNYFV